jgi:signal transduction histidine kinase
MHDRLALIAHEIRSPVAALAAIAEAFRTPSPSLDGAAASRLLRLAVAAGRDVERIVVDATPASLVREPVDPARLVLDVTAAARLRRALVAGHADANLPSVDGDPVRLRQALANLVENAVAHSPAGAGVVVSARRAEQTVRIAVADRGEGIPRSRQQLVLEPGVRFAERPGDGIGLAVARAIAEAHGGALEVDSAPGQGATFTLVLPCAGDGPA